jgi:hypothetical protein
MTTIACDAEEIFWVLAVGELPFLQAETKFAQKLSNVITH